MKYWMVLLSASLTAATASAPLAAMQDVAWPSGFAATAAAGDGWKPYRAETWIFSATPHSQRLEVNYFVLHARDDSAAQIEGRVCEAGGIFKAILERLTVDPR